MLTVHPGGVFGHLHASNTQEEGLGIGGLLSPIIVLIAGQKEEGRGEKRGGGVGGSDLAGGVEVHQTATEERRAQRRPDRKA